MSVHAQRRCKFAAIRYRPIALVCSLEQVRRSRLLFELAVAVFTLTFDRQQKREGTFGKAEFGLESSPAETNVALTRPSDGHNSRGPIRRRVETAVYKASGAQMIRRTK